jgi:hypothetical protein
MLSTLENDLEKISKLPEKKRLKSLQKTLEFVKFFGSQGEQSITGLFKYKKHRSDLNVVFKISVTIDRVIEHEFDILKQLSKITWCDFFVKPIFLLPTHVNSDFINNVNASPEEPENKEENLDESDQFESSGSEIEEEQVESDIECQGPFDENGELYYLNMLLLEHITNDNVTINMAKIIDHGDRNRVWSAMQTVMAALQIAQNNLNFVHFDLHVENILFKKCEDNALFVFRMLDKNKVERRFVIPSFGLYPVIIDCGNSYTNQVTVNRTNISNYQNGLHANWFDSLADVHHFLLNVLHTLEYQTKEYYFFTTRVMWIFRHLRIMRNSGWKQLPMNVGKMVKEQIVAACPAVMNCNLWKKHSTEILEVIMSSVEIPWKQSPEGIHGKLDLAKLTYGTKDLASSLNKAFGALAAGINSLEECEEIESTIALVFVFRELVEHISIIDDRMFSKTATGEKRFKDWKSSIRKACKNINATIPDKFEWKSFINAVRVIIDLMPVIMFDKFKDNLEVIKTAYSKTSVQCPWDMIDLMKRNIAMRLPVSENSVLIVIDDINRHWYKTIRDFSGLADKTPLQQEQSIVETVFGK